MPAAGVADTCVVHGPLHAATQLALYPREGTFCTCTDT